MTPTKWEIYELSEKILQILDIEASKPNHHFGRPFLTAYQIAILFKNMFPETYAQLNTPIGGKGTGNNHSLAQYIARNLSQQIKKGDLLNIEGRFLCMNIVDNLRFNNFGEILEASQLPDLSMFRRTDCFESRRVK